MNNAQTLAYVKDIIKGKNYPFYLAYYNPSSVTINSNAIVGFFGVNATAVISNYGLCSIRYANRDCTLSSCICV